MKHTSLDELNGLACGKRPEKPIPLKTHHKEFDRMRGLAGPLSRLTPASPSLPLGVAGLRLDSDWQRYRKQRACGQRVSLAEPK